MIKKKYQNEHISTLGFLREDLFPSHPNNKSEGKDYEPSSNVNSESRNDMLKPERKMLNKTLIKQQGRKYLRISEIRICSMLENQALSWGIGKQKEETSFLKRNETSIYAQNEILSKNYR